MNAFLPMGALTGSVFFYKCRHRETLVLRAFFDDSGTHDESDAVVMGGVVASEEAWATLEPQWDALLTEFDIPKMHMSHCENNWGRFRQWGKLKRDRAVASFRELIEQTGGRMIASAVSRTVWNSVCAQTRLGEAFAEPIDFLAAMAIRHALQSKRSATEGHEQVSVTFDCRQQSIVPWNLIASGYEKRWPERFAGYSFGNMAKVLPLQAADMIAYEAFVFHCEREKVGKEPTPRPNMAKLINSLSAHLVFYTEESLLDFMAKLEAALTS